MAEQRGANWMTTTSVSLPARTFQMWDYTVSHGELLLRSTKGDAPKPLRGSFSTRIDLVFKGVAALDLPTLLPGLEMGVAEVDDERRVRQEWGPWVSPEHIVFAMHGSNYRGFIAARVVAITEDDGAYHEPSALWPEVK